jgi:hypothetical protein
LFIESWHLEWSIMKTKKRRIGMCINFAKMLELIFVSLTKLISSPWYRGVIHWWLMPPNHPSLWGEGEIESREGFEVYLDFLCYCKFIRSEYFHYQWSMILQLR